VEPAPFDGELHRSDYERIPLEQRLCLTLSQRARAAGSLECFVTARAAGAFLRGLRGRLYDDLLLEVAPPATILPVRLEDVAAVLERLGARSDS
jgi:hypothetical protein